MKVSGPVYHYAKQADTIILIGYSREHVPFPIATSKRGRIRWAACSSHLTFLPAGVSPGTSVRLVKFCIHRFAKTDLSLDDSILYGH